MVKDTRKINLLPNKGDTLLNQFLGWALSIGRLLVILTEMLALGVFAYRFSLDMKIIDFHDQIKQESIIVSAFGEAEGKYRNLQTRLALVKQYNMTSNKPLIILQDVIEMGRGKITFKNILVSKTTIAIEAQAQSAAGLSLFVDALKQYPAITSISVDRVENKTANAVITVNISGAVQLPDK